MLTEGQLRDLTRLFQHGSDDASRALSTWLSRPARVSVEQVEQLALADATAVLGDEDAPVCACTMALEGRCTGQLILSFDDPSGLALADILLGRPAGTSREWGPVEESAALETANIVGCAYLNTLSRDFPDRGTDSQELLPSPPRFSRDFAAALMQFALMDQAMSADLVFLTRTEFHIDGSPVNWSLLFVPDAASLSVLREILVA